MSGTLKKRALACAMSLLLVICMILAFLPVNVLAVTQSEIDALKSDRSELQSQQSEVQSKINSLRTKQNSALELKTALDAKNALTLQQIMNVTEQIEISQELIDAKTEEVEAAQIVADKQLEKYKKRVRAMEERGEFSYLGVILGADSIGEFLSLIDDVASIMKSDKELEKSYRESVDTLKLAREEYENAQAELKTEKAELVVLSDQLQKDITEAAQIIATLQDDINTEADVLSSLTAQEAQIQAKINQKVAELEAQQRQQQQQQQPSGGGGAGNGTISVWPVNCTYITSVQGNRVHPVTGQYGTHKGTDIGASYGSPVYASGAGTIIEATADSSYNGGYGNCVMISHGGGLVTLYAHLSVVSVSYGQSVSAGQLIGYVGATGRVTGAHLHYEVRTNGILQDPQSYFPGLGYSYSDSAWGG